MHFALLTRALFETLYMVITASFCATILALPLAIALTLTRKGGLREQLALYRILALIINIGRSIPFAILIVAIFPFTRWVVGTSIGTTASIVPLTLTAAPFLARVLESALNEVESGIVEAAIVMRARHTKIVFRLLLPEALPAMIEALTLTVVTLISYSAMAGLVGGGGLGKVAIQYGYQRFDGKLMLLTLITLLALVGVAQGIGSALAYRIRKKRGLL